jgi:hypothetical protein
MGHRTALRTSSKGEMSSADFFFDLSDSETTILEVALEKVANATPETDGTTEIAVVPERNIPTEVSGVIAVTA